MDGHVSQIQSVVTPVQSTWTEPFLELEGWYHDHLLWHYDGLGDVEQLLIDDAMVSEDLWRVVPTENILCIVVSPEFFDGIPHRVEVVGRHRGKRAKLTARFASDYHGELEIVRPGLLRGWIFDAACPSRQVRLVAEINDRLLSNEVFATAALSRPGFTGPAACAGFEMGWDPHGGKVTLRIEGTGLLPFGIFDPDSPGSRNCTPVYKRQGPTRIAVVIMVFADTDETLACLETICASQDKIGYEVIVIDDASPNGRGRRQVAERTCAAGFTYIRNVQHLGMAGCANLGFKLRPDHDIVLLDPATEVPSGWLDRLYQAVASDPTIAIAAPLSNSMPAMSPPAPSGVGDALYALSLVETDALCRELNRGIVRDVPIASGLCMYIRRDALNALGVFDAAAFGRGRGEEIDFIARARRDGWRNVIVTDLYVRHSRAMPSEHSSGMLSAPNLQQLRERYPDYDGEITAFTRADPLRDVRRRIQLALWRADKPVVVVVTSALPGGTARHVERLTRDLEATGRRVLWLRNHMDAMAGVLVLCAPDGSATLRYPGEAGVQEALADIFSLKPAFIHVHHLIDLPDSIEALLRRAGVPYVVTFHDYFFGCPRVTLLDEGGMFCEAPPVEHCAPCLAASSQNGSLHPALHPSLAAHALSGETWRAKWGPFLAGAQQIIVPSGATAQYVSRLFPELELSVRPHAAIAAKGIPDSGRPTQVKREGWRVAIIGTTGLHKGSGRLHELIRYCHRREPDLRFVIIGSTDRDAALAHYSNVELAGRYDCEDAVAVIAASRCAVALFLSITPETYCFTLSEALLAGLVPVAFDIGAVGERLRKLGKGMLIPRHSTLEAIVDALRSAAEPYQAPRGAVNQSAGRLSSEAASTIDSVYADLFEDYYALLPQNAEPSAVFVGETEGISADLWCARRFALLLNTRIPLCTVELTLWYHQDHLAQNVAAQIAGGERISTWLTPGSISTIQLPVPDRFATLQRIVVAFDFATPLRPPNSRHGAAKLIGLSVISAEGKHMAYRFEGAGEAAVELSLVLS